MVESSEREEPSSTQAAPVVVVVEGVSAGVAVSDGSRLRFRAIHPRFEILDGSRFARAEQLTHAARRIAKASQD
jgi:hypothetical protein